MDEVKSQLQVLATETNKLEREVGQVRSQLNLIISQQDRQQQLRLLNGLCRMYCFYIVSGKVDDLECFVDSVCEMKARFEDGDIDMTSYSSFLECNNAKFGLNVESLIALLQDGGYTDSPADIGSKTKQKALLSSCESRAFDNDLKPLANEIVRQLRSITLRRMKLGLGSTGHDQ